MEVVPLGETWRAPAGVFTPAGQLANLTGILPLGQRTLRAMMAIVAPRHDQNCDP